MSRVAQLGLLFLFAACTRGVAGLESAQHETDFDLTSKSEDALFESCSSVTDQANSATTQRQGFALIEKATKECDRFQKAYPSSAHMQELQRFRGELERLHEVRSA